MPKRAKPPEPAASKSSKAVKTAKASSAPSAPKKATSTVEKAIATMVAPVVEVEDENAALGMPNLVRARRLARQTLDSALTTLHALGVDDARVVVESVGRGWEPGTIVEQTPAPGAPLTARTRIVLKVAGPS